MANTGGRSSKRHSRAGHGLEYLGDRGRLGPRKFIRPQEVNGLEIIRGIPNLRLIVVTNPRRSESFQFEHAVSRIFQATSSEVALYGVSPQWQNTIEQRELEAPTEHIVRGLRTLIESEGNNPENRLLFHERDDEPVEGHIPARTEGAAPLMGDIGEGALKTCYSVGSPLEVVAHLAVVNCDTAATIGIMPPEEPAVEAYILDRDALADPLVALPRWLPLT